MRCPSFVLLFCAVIIGCTPDPTGTSLSNDDHNITGSKKPPPAPPAKKDEPPPAPSSSQPPPPAPQGDQAPTLTSVTPSSVTIGASPGGVDLVLTGSRFAAGAQVDLAGTKIPANVTSDSEIHIHAPADAIKASGTLRLSVFAKPGVESNPITFTVANPTSTTISSVTPSSVTVGDPAVPLAVTGAGFAPESIIKFNGAALTTTFVSATQITATVPQSAIADAARVSITVSLGADVVSLPFAFEVRNPTPTARSVAPSSITAGGSAVAVTITGTGFTRGSTAYAGNTPLATTLLSATSLRATVPSTLLANAGSVNLTVQTGAPGGGTSSAVAIAVQAATQSTTSTRPDCAYYCDDFGYERGECYADWYCIASGTYANCLAQTTCAAPAPEPDPNPNACDYRCADYGYDPGECYQDWTCNASTDCLEPIACD
jgi:hypothetical protein